MEKSTTILKPFIRWAGGKQILIKYLLANLPPDGDFNRYYEPFLGAGSLFFANGFHNASLSDVNKNLINTFRQVKLNPELIFRLIQNHKNKYTKEYYYKIREVYNNHLDENTPEQVARFIFLLHTCYNGIYRVNLKGQYNVPIGKLNPNLPTLAHLKNTSKKLQGIKLAVKSYKEIISQVKAKDLVYLDPPYPSLPGNQQWRQFTKDKFSESDQYELAEFAEELNRKKCYVMISNSQVPLIEKLYSQWTIEKIPVTRSVSCKKERLKIHELIIKNY